MRSHSLLLVSALALTTSTVAFAKDDVADATKRNAKRAAITLGAAAATPPVIIATGFAASSPEVVDAGYQIIGAGLSTGPMGAAAAGLAVTAYVGAPFAKAKLAQGVQRFKSWRADRSDRSSAGKSMAAKAPRGGQKVAR